MDEVDTLQTGMPHRSSLCQMASMVRRREISPIELLDFHLRQIEAQNPKLNAFVVVLAEEARKAARVAEKKILSNDPLGTLHGVPVTVKDSFDIEGLPTLCGSRFRLDHRADRDATAVARLRAQGAVIVGKTNCPEFLSSYETDNYITGRTNNPWDLERTAGGSSGGEAAAIAGFCSAGGLGSDGGGSVRIPAHFSGIAALKPTPGRVSAAGHYPLICHPGGLLGVAGPMARTAEDLQMLFSATAGYDSQDPFSAPVPLRAPDMTDLRIGIMEQFYGVPVQPAIRDGLHKAAKVLEQLRIPVEPFEPRNVGVGRKLGIGYIEVLWCNSLRRWKLLVPHDPAKLAPKSFEVVDLNGSPEVVVAHLLYGFGPGLHRVLILGQ
jgi:Asp-tRNA(Asn)/Glu-tRNA(Gln) amidotransferase A subunit family amidase